MTTDDILSGEERKQANAEPPEDKADYMRRYVEALKARTRKDVRQGLG